MPHVKIKSIVMWVIACNFALLLAVALVLLFTQRHQGEPQYTGASDVGTPATPPQPIAKPSHTAQERREYAKNLAIVQTAMGRPSSAHTADKDGTTLAIETEDAGVMARGFNHDPILVVMHDLGFKQLIITDKIGGRYKSNLE